MKDYWVIQELMKASLLFIFPTHRIYLHYSPRNTLCCQDMHLRVKAIPQTQPNTNQSSLSITFCHTKTDPVRGEYKRAFSTSSDVTKHAAEDPGLKERAMAATHRTSGLRDSTMDTLDSGLASTHNPNGSFDQHQHPFAPILAPIQAIYYC